MKIQSVGNFTPCPDFDLAELQSINANFLDATDKKDREVNAYILTLALIFNDLKGLLWVLERLSEGKSKEQGISAYKGQWGGFNNQYNRLVMGVLHELLELVNKNQKILEHPLFKSCLQKQSKDVKKYWGLIAHYATNRKGKKPTTDLGYALLLVRNNAAFHYYQTDSLYQGYQNWKSKACPESKFAYVSLGQTMMTTRFFFADAASENCVNTLLNMQGLEMTNISEVIHQVNSALRFIVERYIKNQNSQMPSSSKR
jgi:hypothetical protein